MTLIETRTELPRELLTECVLKSLNSEAEEQIRQDAVDLIPHTLCSGYNALLKGDLFPLTLSAGFKSSLAPKLSFTEAYSEKRYYDELASSKRRFYEYIQVLMGMSAWAGFSDDEQIELAGQGWNEYLNRILESVGTGKK